jgi:hypothetical protein
LLAAGLNVGEVDRALSTNPGHSVKRDPQVCKSTLLYRSFDGLVHFVVFCFFFKTHLSLPALFLIVFGSG